MGTTTIRVDTETHARLRELSKESGLTLLETVRDAAEALERQKFGHRVAAEMAALRADDRAWNDYIAEAGSTSVLDGIA